MLPLMGGALAGFQKVSFNQTVMGEHAGEWLLANYDVVPLPSKVNGRDNQWEVEVIFTPLSFGAFTDCNANAIPDDWDVYRNLGNSKDCDGNGIPDECKWKGFVKYLQKGRPS